MYYKKQWTIFSIFILLVSEILAMKPAPFQKIDYIDASTQLHLISDPERKTTQVFDTDGKEIWSMNQFIGRKQILLSPDGKVLILLGSHYFGSRLSTNPKSIILEVYHMGKESKKLNFQQVFKQSIREVIDKYQVPQLGGGWFAMNRFIKTHNIDWSTRTLSFIYTDQSKVSLSF